MGVAVDAGQQPHLFTRPPLPTAATDHLTPQGRWQVDTAPAGPFGAVLGEGLALRLHGT